MSLQPPPYTTFPPFYTLQSNLQTRARQLELWTSWILMYCAHHRVYKLSLASPPSELFGNSKIKRGLKPSDCVTVLEHMAKVEGRVEWLDKTKRFCYVHWKLPDEWADVILKWIEDTGQKGSVLTVYELRESDAVRNMEWRDMDEDLLKKVLGVLVKKGKAQIFGQQDGLGVKFF
ncbi:ESCRT-II complex, vps25 subunit [Piedraia hortae CBS 480.64]|uniref:ESCRT-II complex subunit VPS25 n=1 Tax=Piedraia hortae CBS 480.64 TaxID=1314780 RepID=A0A6A7BQJ5_9PEZI|nr:ESCRT-II complex, vps25 subunit [Piedraia hortae CBS 480.64]